MCCSWHGMLRGPLTLKSAGNRLLSALQSQTCHTLDRKNVRRWYKWKLWIQFGILHRSRISWGKDKLCRRLRYIWISLPHMNICCSYSFRAKIEMLYISVENESNVTSLYIYIQEKKERLSARNLNCFVIFMLSFTYSMLSNFNRKKYFLSTCIILCKSESKLKTFILNFLKPSRIPNE